MARDADPGDSQWDQHYREHYQYFVIPRRLFKAYAAAERAEALQFYPELERMSKTSHPGKWGPRMPAERGDKWG